MGVGVIGALASAASLLLTVVLSIIVWVVRRNSREAREARKLKATNLAALRWHYRVSALAATRGWDTDPSWPETPRELTAEYLTETAEQDPAGPLAQLAQAARELGQGKP